MINQQVKIIFRFSFLFFLQSSSVFAATYYLSPTGSDTNNGSAGAPLATIMMAQSIAASGDTVIINAGTYTVPVSISLVSGVWAIVNNINKNGITYQAAPGTRPVFDFSGVTDPGLRIVAFWVTATGVTFQGFDVIGVRETITGVNNQSVGMFGWGSKNCTWNQVHVHDGECVGFYFQKVSSNNLVYQCDSYNNAGIDSFSYGNADGFGCHPSPGGTGNVFREDRAWNNSDDGYDCINSSEVVVFDHCWSYK
ncbi:MAG TPA: pectate lyase, partial [bacterium]